jgi:Uma2 family endonuclease
MLEASRNPGYTVAMAILAQPVTESGVEPLTLRLGSALGLSDDQLLELCRLNKDLRIERTSQGDLEIMTPAGGGSARRNADVITQLGIWAREDHTGVVFDSSAGFLLPSGAMRAPDAAWVRRSRLTGLSREEKEKFLPLCPDFVVEVRSATDYLDAQREKLQEYMDNGAALGWLIDPFEKTVHVYRPGVDPEILEEPQSVSADPVLPGFELQLEEIWNPLW